jgi:hypothetical protein
MAASGEREVPRWRRWIVGRLLPAAILLALVVGALALARVPGAERVEGHPGLSGFRQQAVANQERYDEGQPVELTYRVCRSRPWSAATNSGFSAEWRVVDEQGEVVADTSHRVYPAVLIPVRWWPGQCRSVEYEWDQRYWNQHRREGEEQHQRGLPVRRDRVEPGVYRFEVWWDGSPGGEPDELTPDPILTDSFELRP